MARLVRIALVRTVQKAVVILHTDGPWHVVLVTRQAEHGDTIGVLVGEAPVLDEPSVEKLLDRQHGGVEIREFSFVHELEGAILAIREEGGAPEDRHIADRKVEIVQINVFTPQALDGSLAGCQKDVRVVVVKLAMATDTCGIALRRKVKLAALSAVFLEPIPHPRLRGLSIIERDRIELCSVKEVDARGDKGIHLRMALRLVGVERPPSHGSATDLRYHHVCFAELDILELVMPLHRHVRKQSVSARWR
mmetsp:Transcript_70098/g.182701  ORF Transcript_70098/g.182701 Transcript_70098/m.182701 type:complete len:250 (-) Transcript_70098:95-844(-)